MATSAALFVIAVVAMTRMGTAFLPEFNEGTLTIQANTLPGTSLQKGPYEGGAPVGGESRVYSLAFEPQHGSAGTETEYKLAIDLWDDLTTRETNGTYVIERVVVREFTF